MSALLAHLADRVTNRPLMILPTKLAMILAALEGRLGLDVTGLEAGGDWEEVLARRPEASRFAGQYELADPNDPKSKKPYRQTADGVAVIPLLGSLVNRGGWLDAMSGITSYEKLKFQIGAAARDPSVSSIILDIDSPGGEAVGAFEAGEAVRAAAGAKQVIAVVNGMAASAAYAIAAQASRIVTTASGISGSIGIVMLHADYSVAIANQGIKPTLIFAGARKADGNPYQPLTDNVRAELKAEVDRFYDLFVTGVAQGRPGLTEEAIRATEARTYIGADAVAAGLADAVGSFESVLSELSAKPAALTFNHPKGRTSMTQKTFTQADIDAAVQAALAAQTAASATAAAGPSAADAVKAERERIAAVRALPEAAGRENLALTLATTTDLPVDQIKAALAAAPAGVAADRAGGSDLGLSVAPAKLDANPQAVSAMWDAALTSRGLKIGG